MGWPLVLLQVGILGGSYAYQRWIKDHEQDSPKRDAWRIPRSRENAPIPLIYGTARVNEPYLAGVFAYSATPIEVGGVVTGYNYEATLHFILGVPMGDTGSATAPYSELRSIWVNDAHLIARSPRGPGEAMRDQDDGEMPVSFPAGSGHPNAGMDAVFAYHGGTFDQARDSGLSANFDDDPDLDVTLLPSYPGLAQMVFRNRYGGGGSPGSSWGPAGNAPIISAEVYAVTSPLGRGAIADPGDPDLFTLHDANPAEVVFDLLCNPFGRAGIAESKVDNTSFGAAADVLETEGIGFSGVIDSARELVDILRDIMAQVGGVLFEDFSDGLIKMKLFRDDASTATFGPSEIDRVQWKAATWANTYNTVHLTYTSRAREYEDATITGTDDAHIEEFGIREQSVRYPYCCTEAQAKRLLARELKLLSTPAGSGTLTMNRSATDVSPGDVITVNYPEHGLSNVDVRVLRVRHGTLADARIQLDVAEDIFAIDYDVNDDGWQNPPLAPSVSPIEQAYVQESPRWFNAKSPVASVSGPEDPRLMYLAKAPSGAETFDAYASADDGATYPTDRVSASFKHVAKVHTAYPRHIGTAISIKEVSNASVLQDATETQLRLFGANMIQVGEGEDAELIQYDTVTDAGGGVYVLSNVKRGCLDTSPRDHAVDDPVWIITPSSGGTAVVVQIGMVGDTVRGVLDTYLARMVPRNLWGNGVLDEADDYEVATANRAARPYPVDDLEIDDE